jgi:exopolyphosphatase/guanosine-5'-triphosphate,3'-diphosphate pyrophosphatase
VVGAIDCGTNSIRLLVARAEGSDDGAAGGAGDGTDGAGPVRLVDLHREMRVVRLGEGVDATGQLSEAALERTFAAAEDYARTLRELGAESVRFVATSASRDARNAGVFTAGIRERLGVEPEVISGDEEAALSFAGAASVLDPAALDTGVAGNTDAGTGDSAAAPAGAGGRERKVLVVDLGGGSTEFVLGTLTGPGGPQATDAVSVPMGCVRFTERHLHGDPPTADEIAAATADIEAVLDGVEAAVPLGEASAVVGVAGTITTVTAAALGLTEYDAEAIHGTRLDRATTTRISGQLLRATREERAALPYMHPGRVDVIGAGALIWSTLLRRVERATGGAVASAITSEHDILDGIALSQLA